MPAKLKVIIFLSIIISSCFPKDDLFEALNKFDVELPQVAIDKCLKKNPLVSEFSCNVKNCLASPLTLLAVQELLIEVDAALKKVDIDYWVDSGSAIGAARGFLLPWDDDVDLGVLRENFSAEKIKKLKEELAHRGFSLAPHTSPLFLNNAFGVGGLYQVSYGKDRFLALIYKNAPSTTFVDAENLWTKYQLSGSHFPHLDIFEFVEPKPGMITYAARLFARGQWKGQLIEKNKIVGNRQVEILGRSYPGVKDPDEYFRIAYHTDKILNDFVIFQDHKPRCEKLRFDDIREHKELLQFFLDYLQFVFKDEFDPTKAKQNYGL